MYIEFSDGVRTLFTNAEIGDYVRNPHGRLCIVVPQGRDDKGIYNAVVLANGHFTYFAPDEKVEVFPNVKFK